MIPERAYNEVNVTERRGEGGEGTPVKVVISKKRPQDRHAARLSGYSQNPAFPPTHYVDKLDDRKTSSRISDKEPIFDLGLPVTRNVDATQ